MTTKEANQHLSTYASLTDEERVYLLSHTVRCLGALLAYDAKAITKDQLVAITKIRESEMEVMRAEVVQATLMTLAEIESIPTSGIN